MHLSVRQQLFLNYLLERLQFSAGNFRKDFLEHLAKRCQEFVNLASVPLRRNVNTGEIIFPEDHEFKKYVEQDNRLLPTRFNIIDLLMLECDIKRRRKYKALKPSKTTISATDISQFTYCPVAWSIAKTYELPKLASTRVGASMHEQYKLLNFVRTRKPDGLDSTAKHDLLRHATQLVCNPAAKELLRDLADSVAVFVGTTSDSDERKWFIGKDNRYIGQPDYIFFNVKTKSYFVVEEKFHMIRQPPRWDLSADWCAEHGYDPEAIEQERQRTVFYDNHLNQLRSYVYAIRDYGSLYGYLVYWRYYFTERGMRDEAPAYIVRIEQLHARKVTETSVSDRDALAGVYVDIKNAMQNEEVGLTRHVDHHQNVLDVFKASCVDTRQANLNLSRTLMIGNT